MNARSPAGFSLVEMMMAAALTCLVTGVLLELALKAQAAVMRQDELTDLQQRLRVASTALQRDLLLAGAGPTQGPARGPLPSSFPAILPARAGERDADPELSFASDRISVFYVPESGSQTALDADAGGPSAPLVIDAAWPGCPPGGSCGLSSGDRALIFDPSGSGAYDIFTVATAAGGLVSAAPGSSWSYAYVRGSPVVAVVQRVYYLDPDTRRLMIYDGDQSDGPLIDHVSAMHVSYYAGPSAQVLTPAQLVDGPVLGVAPNRFDVDLLRVRRVRITITLHTPSTPGESAAQLRQRRLTFDVTLRNLGVPR
jgi:type II secretory pathway pseudopilin PulG